MANKMKAFQRNPGNVAFCCYRYSSDAQRDVSIDQQRQAAHEYVEKHGYILPQDCECEDRGITGTTTERPGLRRMLFEAKNKRGGKGVARKLNPEEVDFWLTGHIYCGECGAPLHGISGTSKAGNIYYYYTCLNHKKKVCKMGNQSKAKIETIVRYTLDRMLEDSTLRLFIAKMCFDYYEDSKSDDKGLIWNR